MIYNLKGSIKGEWEDLVFDKDLNQKNSEEAMIFFDEEKFLKDIENFINDFDDDDPDKDPNSGLKIIFVNERRKI